MNPNTRASALNAKTRKTKEASVEAVPGTVGVFILSLPQGDSIHNFMVSNIGLLSDPPAWTNLGSEPMVVPDAEDDEPVVE